MIVISTGCPASIGPEVSVRAASAWLATPAGKRGGCVLVGDWRTLLQAAELVGVDGAQLERFEGRPSRGKLQVLSVGPSLSAKDRKPGKPTAVSGCAQLEYVNTGFRLVKESKSAALVTAAVSKAVIQSSGAPGAKRFLGHTEWLQSLDGASHTTMCFTTPSWVTALATTHVPLARVSTELSAERVTHAIVDVATLARSILHRDPRVAVCSLNPHAGENELLGKEENRLIVPGIAQARRQLGRRCKVEGPIGAETAYRKAQAGSFDAVVAMYHDQATIPTKLMCFGGAVNVTMGLSIVRTSVDHGTAYDIAWRGSADAEGMRAAIELGAKLASA